MQFSACISITEVSELALLVPETPAAAGGCGRSQRPPRGRAGRTRFSQGGQLLSKNNSASSSHSSSKSHRRASQPLSSASGPASWFSRQKASGIRAPRPRSGPTVNNEPSEPRPAAWLRGTKAQQRKTNTGQPREAAGEPRSEQRSPPLSLAPVWRRRRADSGQGAGRCEAVFN